MEYPFCAFFKKIFRRAHRTEQKPAQLTEKSRQSLQGRPNQRAESQEVKGRAQAHSQQGEGPQHPLAGIEGKAQQPRQHQQAPQQVRQEGPAMAQQPQQVIAQSQAQTQRPGPAEFRRLAAHGQQQAHPNNRAKNPAGDASS